MVAAPGLDWISAASLGALQGVAEFLPISSSGHLALGQAWAGIDPATGGHTLNVIVHTGTLLAILVVYRATLRDLLRGVLARDPASLRMAIAVAIATTPLALALVPAVKHSVIAFESDVRLVGGALLFTAGILALTHRATVRRSGPGADATPGTPAGTVPSHAHALAIGAAQLLAITPGVSRSGTTIAMALLLGASRDAAARFSFLIAIPAITGATLDEVRSVDPSSLDPGPYALAFAVSFAVGLLALRGLLAILGRYGLVPFVPYLLVVGSLAIALA